MTFDFTASLRLRVACALAAMLLSTAASAQTTGARSRIPAAGVDSLDAVRRIVGAADADGVREITLAISLYTRPDEAFDGISALIRAAHDRGLRVHASIETNVVTDAGVLPASRDHVLYNHPEWLMVPRVIAAEMLRIDLRSPGYIGRLARWTRANAPRVAGLYLSPLAPAAADYAAHAVEELVRRYAFDVIDIRASPYPDDEFDYSREAMELFREEVRARLSAVERARMDEIDSIDPFAYPNEFPDQWRLFRRVRLDDLVSRVSAAARAARPSVLLASGDPATPDDPR